MFAGGNRCGQGAGSADGRLEEGRGRSTFAIKYSTNQHDGPAMIPNTAPRRVGCCLIANRTTIPAPNTVNAKCHALRPVLVLHASMAEIIEKVTTKEPIPIMNASLAGSPLTT